jgi:antitoxin YefM
MRAVTVEEAARHLNGLVTRVADDAEPAILISDSGRQVVVLPIDDYNGWKETHYLLASPANAAHLRKSIEEAAAGRLQAHPLIDEP